ncbi:hypothetical protein ACV822_000029 [Klebsiella aerogenes]|uniref:hypothetical protein n=1 Tax=Klebsiella aerogenes TaxID=548 RepID=UPI00280FF0C7|nr:hypothetical protein [Klebsiella aerogenes]MDQ8581642.1 hypothetical protein [Klebsiella aerogenes]
MASKSPVALSLTGATALCDLVARMSAAQSGRPGGFKIPGGAVAYRGYNAVRFGSPDERSAIREGQVASKSPVALSLTGATALQRRAIW